MIKWIGEKVEDFKTIFRNNLRIASTNSGLFGSILEIGNETSGKSNEIKGTENPDGGGSSLNISSSGATGTNQAGGALTLYPGTSTGNAVSGNMSFLFSNPVSSGSTKQGLVSSIIMKGNTGLCSFYKGIDINVTSSGVGLEMPTYPETDTDTAATIIQNIQTGGVTFNDNDTSLMTAGAIDDKINTKYASSIISFVGQATMVSSGNWVGTGKAGISNHTWNKDYAVNTETNGTTEATVPKQWGHSGIRVPFACVVDGISCAIQNIGGNRQATVGLFFARAADGTTAVDWGTVDNTEPILQIHADANNEGGGYTVKPSHAEVTGSDIAMAAGDMFYPAIKLTGITESGDTDSVYASVSVHIKTLIA